MKVFTEYLHHNSPGIFTYQKFLVIVPSGQTKIWKYNKSCGPAKARDAYIGETFMINKAFAEKFSDRWVVLSAKYGFINPDFIVPKDYNASFNRPSTHPIGIEALKQQSKDKRLRDYDIVIALGGRDYTEIVKKVFEDAPKVIALTQGLPVNKAMSRVKSLLIYEKNELSKVLNGIL